MQQFKADVELVEGVGELTSPPLEIGKRGGLSGRYWVPLPQFSPFTNVGVGIYHRTALPHTTTSPNSPQIPGEIIPVFMHFTMQTIQAKRKIKV